MNLFKKAVKAALKDFKRRIALQKATTDEEKLYWCSKFLRGCRSFGFQDTKAGKSCIHAFPKLSSCIENGEVDRVKVSNLLLELQNRITENLIDAENIDEHDVDIAKLASFRKLQSRAKKLVLKKRKVLLTAVTDDQGVQHSDADLAAEVLRRKWQKLGEGKVGHEGWRAILRQHVQVAPPDTCWEVSYDVFWEKHLVRFAVKTTALGQTAFHTRYIFFWARTGLGQGYYMKYIRR